MAMEQQRVTVRAYFTPQGKKWKWELADGHESTALFNTSSAARQAGERAFKKAARP